MPSGGTRPLAHTSTPVRGAIEPPWAATAAGRWAAGTANTTRSWREVLELGGAHHRDVLGQLDAVQVALVAAQPDQRLGLLAGAAAEVDLEAGAGEHDRDRGAPRAGADDGGAAQRRQAAEPLPLEHHVGPDAVGDGGGELRRGVLDLREGERAADADADLVRADAPPLADRLGADDRHGDDGRAGLQREPADAAARAPERARADARALGEDQHRVTALEDRARGLEHVAVALAAADGEGAERVQEPGR